MSKDEQVVANLEQWQQETGQRLPLPVELIVELEGNGVIDLVTGEREVLRDDWVVFTEIWKAECRRCGRAANYCALAVVLKRADTHRALSASGEWADYLEQAKLLIYAREERAMVRNGQ